MIFNREIYKVFDKIDSENVIFRPGKWIIILCIVFFASLFLPWTQTIRTTGEVSILDPSKRFQNIQTVIPGKIVQWYVTDGDRVNEGDTLVFLQEIKDEYFDTLLLERTDQQIQSKRLAIEAYSNKIAAYRDQINLTRLNRDTKLAQIRNYIIQNQNKIFSDSIEYEAAKLNFQFAENQYKRFESLFADGLRSKTELEQRNAKFQDAKAKYNTAEIKLRNLRNELTNLYIELDNTKFDYDSKIAKAESELMSAISEINDGEASLAKLENTRENYKVRRRNLYITAPQSGLITKTIRAGVGENIKEGEIIATIMPNYENLAAELYFDPVDIPLLAKGRKIVLIFDGFPAFVISGWPSTFTGTFDGKIYAIDKFISPNGKFRAFITSYENRKDWPDLLNAGTGVTAIALLEDVPVWYEMWRQLSGFPPEFYSFEEDKKLNAK